MKKLATTLVLLLLSITMFVVKVESKKKHHHEKKSSFDVLNGERKENVYMAPVPDVKNFTSDGDPSPSYQKIQETPEVKVLFNVYKPISPM